MNRYRIKQTKHYVFVSHGGRDNLYEVIRPVVQMRVLFFWITIKKFVTNNKDIANQDAEHLLNRLNRNYKYE